MNESIFDTKGSKVISEAIIPNQGWPIGKMVERVIFDKPIICIDEMNEVIEKHRQDTVSENDLPDNYVSEYFSTLPSDLIDEIYRRFWHAVALELDKTIIKEADDG